MIRALMVLSFVALLAGCSGQPPAPEGPTKSEPASTKRPDKHGHQPGQHGGVIVDIGADNYHAEPVFEKDGLVRLHMLDQDETKVLEVDAQPVEAFVKTPGDGEPETIVFRPDPRPDDTKGKTSRFVAQLPRAMVGKKVQVVITSMRIGNERFRVPFSSAPEKDDHGMPTKVANDDERKLYLTAAGKYTAEDIQANGNRTASQAFKGVKAEHDLNPKPGDKICPITLTKANANFAWVVGGKKYEFCCPPCVDEFVTLAKEKPDEVKEPEFYKKK